MMHINITRFAPGIAWFFVVLVLLCLPGKDIPSNNWFDKIYFDKWVHAGIFGLLALLFMLPFALSPLEDREKLQYFIRIAIATSIWGLTTEFIQKYCVSGRSFDLLDWLADSLGAFTAFTICRKKYI
ncbi:MAG: VanZ family protein [Ferruginibacter sp.]|nr:VanZ family protein [Ferruginibacter sp.]